MPAGACSRPRHRADQDVSRVRVCDLTGLAKTTGSSRCGRLLAAPPVSIFRITHLIWRQHDRIKLGVMHPHARERIEKAARIGCRFSESISEGLVALDALPPTSAREPARVSRRPFLWYPKTQAERISGTWKGRQAPPFGGYRSPVAARPRRVCHCLKKVVLAAGDLPLRQDLAGAFVPVSPAS